MSFLGQPISQLQPPDFDQLVTRPIAEADRLEYKRDMYGRDDDSKRELLRDVTALANHHGGHLLIGVDEDSDGAAKAVDGVTPDDRGSLGDWIRDLCLASIDERILGLNVAEIPMALGNVVVVIEIPESPRGCHMVTYKGLNQFWKRHGRRKDRMTVDEIRDGFLRVAAAQERIDRFIRQRRAEILEAAGGENSMVLSAIPAYFRDQPEVDVQDQKLRILMVNPPILPSLPCDFGTVACGEPFPSLEGRRAERSSAAHLVVYRNGYVEFGTILQTHGDRLVYAGRAHTSYVNSFAGFIRAFYGSYFPGSSVAVHWAIYNARGLRLATSDYDWQSRPPWPKDHLDLGEFLVEDIESGARLLPRRMCDRLWNAFRYERAEIFDAEGNWV